MAMQQSLETSNTEHLMVAAIDFGTTYSGYAFSFKHDPLKVSMNKNWIGQSLLSMKTPTTVLLNPDQSFHSFGYEAEEKYLDLAEKELHADWYFYKRFKMLLHGKLNMQRDVMIEDATGKEMSVMTIFSIAINYLRQHLLDMTANRGAQLNNSEICWVLTVPAIWNEPAKQFMREAAVKGGIPSDQLKLALEPEAASVYCSTMPLERNNGQFGPFSPETVYMVLDCGGGTVDVTVHEVKHDGTLKEIHRASGGAWGGTKVDDSYMELLDELFGKETMKAFRQKFKIDHLELLRDFETKKRTIGSKPDDSSMTIKTSATLSEHIQDTNQCTLKEAVNRSNLREKVIIRRDRMTISGDIMEGIFSMSINSIIKHVQDVLNHPKVNRLDKILMVGGFSESPLIQAAVKKSFTDVMVMTPDDPGLAVLKGAVIYGHRPSAISSRVVQNTYGVAVTTDFNESIHPPENRFDQIYCRNVFSKFITIDENIDSNTVCSKTYSINDKSAPVCIDIMVSPLENPVVTTRDCTKLGTVLIKCPIGGWRSKAELIVELKFGGTEFSVRAVEKYTQVEQEATFDFLQ